jgi:hypothetical protein
MAIIAQKTSRNKQQPIKSFAELKMHSPGLKHMTPHQHPASKHLRGTQLHDHTFMTGEGHTGKTNDKREYAN